MICSQPGEIGCYSQRSRLHPGDCDSICRIASFLQSLGQLKQMLIIHRVIRIIGEKKEG